MDERERCLAWGVYISAALYDGGVFAAGLVTHNPVAWKLAIATAGIAYISYAGQIMGMPRRIAMAVVVLNFVLGACAGIALIP
jgi:hypothetical protein